MKNRMREARKAKGMTMQEVAARCSPPTTASTIGRFETGQRSISVGWISRIAAAIGVDPHHLVDIWSQDVISVAATLKKGCVLAADEGSVVMIPRIGPDFSIVLVETETGAYRSGDEIWCEEVAPSNYIAAVNHDVLVQKASGRFLFGRLLEHKGGDLIILPLEAGKKPRRVVDPTLVAVVKVLTRNL
jgi:transcriptional regulator with XRE-family HTH domain